MSRGIPALCLPGVPGPGSFNRRSALKAIGLVAATPLLVGAQSRRRVGVIGGGLAGVATAWLLDGTCDVALIEAAPVLGGNIQSVDVDLDGHQVVVDMGAQYFHSGPYPTYVQLLSLLGLYPPNDLAGAAHEFTASITVTGEGEAAPRFISPWWPERFWPLLAWWNWGGIIAFALAFAGAQAREQDDESWTLTLEEWLPTLGLPRAQWEGIVLPWAASLSAGDIEQARGFSARAVMVFAAKALPTNPFDPVTYQVLRPGLREVVTRLTSQMSTVNIHTDAPVQGLVRLPSGEFRIHRADGRTHVVDDVVLAASGPSAVRILEGLPEARAQADALRGIEFFDARLVLHRSAAFAPTVAGLRSFLNCDIQGNFCEASMWMRDVITGAPRRSTSRLWKSWISHRDVPRAALYETSYTHVLPSAVTMRALERVRDVQGQGGVWIAGGYTHEYDAQETALRSAISVAVGMGVDSVRLQHLLS